MAYRKSYLSDSAERARARARARAWGEYDTPATELRAARVARELAADARRADRDRCVTPVARSTALDRPRALALAISDGSALAFASTLAVACAIALGDWATAAERLDSFQRQRATVRRD